MFALTHTSYLLTEPLRKINNYHVAQANTPLDEEGHFIHKNVSGRYREETQEYERSKFDYMDVSPKMVFSVATALIPFLENDDANLCEIISSRIKEHAVDQTFRAVYCKRLARADLLI